MDSSGGIDHNLEKHGHLIHNQSGKIDFALTDLVHGLYVVDVFFLIQLIWPLYFYSYLLLLRKS